MTDKAELMKRAVVTAMATALTLGVAACQKNEQIPMPENYGQTSPPGVNPERVAEQAGKPVDDATVTAKVKSAFVAEPNLQALIIDVDTTAGVVTLKGTADTVEQKQRAEQIATTVQGVRSVKNELMVGRG